MKTCIHSHMLRNVDMTHLGFNRNVRMDFLIFNGGFSKNSPRKCQYILL